MITKLTEEQEELIPVVRYEYIKLCETKFNETDAIEGVKFVYQLAGQKEPKIIIFDSPLACQFAANIINNIIDNKIQGQVNQQVRQQVWQQVRQQVLQQVYDQVLQQVNQQVNQQVWQQVEQQVWQQVEQQVSPQANHQISPQIKEYYDTSYDGIWNFSWMSFFDYFDRIGIVKNTKFEQYKRYIKSGIFTSIYLYGFAISSKNPILLLRDEKNRMHNTEGPAIQWADGYYQNYVHGVYFEYDLFDKIFIKKDIIGKDILNIKNTEQKAVTIQWFGYDRMINELGAEMIDSTTTISGVDMKPCICELYDFMLDNVRSRFIRLEDHSTHKITTLVVPVEKETETVIGAIGWTFGMKEDEYCPEIET